jgi:WS/DGAT/MGAT family acyltransferase
MNRMSAQDASFLHIESDESPMHVGGVSLFEGPPPPFDDVLAMVAGKLVLVPRYRQVVRFVPFALAPPVWVDDPHFNLGYHVRRTALPHPGGDQELRTLVSRVMSQNLDRAKPLWEMWLAEGFGEERWALVSKVHHCMVDGVASTDLMTVLLDNEPQPEVAPPDAWTPEPSPGAARLLAEAVVERAANPFAAAGQLGGALRTPRQFAGLLEDTSRGLIGLARHCPAFAALVAQRAARPAPPLELGARTAGRRATGSPRTRRHGQRRGAGRHHSRLSRTAAVPRRARGSGVANAGTCVRSAARRTRQLQQPGFGDVR